MTQPFLLMYLALVSRFGTMMDDRGDTLKTPLRDPVAAEFEHRKGMALITGLIELAHTVVVGVVALGIVYFMYRAVGELAGENTGVSLGIYGLSSPFLNFSVYLMGPGGCGVATVFYMLYRREKRKRLMTVRHLSEHARKLEKMIDNRRSSSGLMPDGRTNPSDM